MTRATKKADEGKSTPQKLQKKTEPPSLSPRELQAWVAEAFGRGGIVADEQTNDDAIRALQIVDAISDRSSLSYKAKLSVLGVIYQAVAKRLDDLTNAAPETAPALWEDRKRRFMSPCDFVIENYPTYGKGLKYGDIRRLDKKLYVALNNYKIDGLWPKDFDLPTRSEELDTIFSGGRESSSEEREESMRIDSALREALRARPR